MINKSLIFVELKGDKNKVFACSALNCVAYGIPDKTSPSLRNKRKITCPECNLRLSSQTTLGCISCNECKTIGNIFDETKILAVAKSVNIPCLNCGSNNTQLKLFDRVLYEKVTSLSENDSTEESNSEQLRVSPTKLEAKITSKSRKKTTNRNTTRSAINGVSLAATLPELKSIAPAPGKSVNHNIHESKVVQKQNTKKTKLTNSEKHFKKLEEKLNAKFESENDPERSPQKTQKKRDFPWKEVHNKKKMVIIQDEFEQPQKTCLACGVTIPSGLQQSRPGVRYCYKHLELDGTPNPTNEGIISREGAKKMSGQDRNRAQQTKRVL